VNALLRGGALLCAVAAGLTAGCGGGTDQPIRIGVVLNLTGPNTVGARKPLEWARDNVNAAGGIEGRPIEFVYKDLAHEPLADVVRTLASDDSIAAVIGPASSADALRAASTFVRAEKVMVTPSATSADLFRAFSTYRPQYFWRPVESDIGQVRAMLKLATSRGARSVALVTGDSAYGNTFFDWFGFLATDTGLRVTTTIRYSQQGDSCRVPLDRALRSGADAVLAVPDGLEQAICMAQEWRASGSRPRLILSDSAQSPSMIRALGSRATGLEGTGLASDPSSGFKQAFEARFHEPLSTNAANIYDSVLLVAYGLARSHGEAGASLANAIKVVVGGNGRLVRWDRAGVATMLRAIKAGRSPAVEGAVGRWNFDRDVGIERVASTYEHWRVARRRFAIAGYVSTAGTRTARNDRSAGRTPATPTRGNTVVGGGYDPGQKTGTWALLVAASDGWDNYRHQADVVAQYERLRAGGVPPDHIVVVSADDIANNPRNRPRGTVRYAVRGRNLYRGFHADYPLHGMTAERLMAILSGRASPEDPKVLRPTAGDNVFVFIAGHGNQNGVYLGLGDPVPPPGGAPSIITPSLLGGTVAAMASRRAYRRMLIAVEACEAGTLGRDLRARGAILISAANPVEDSLSANYDASKRTFLADRFAYVLWRAEQQTPDASLPELYQQLYLNVSGSHVSAYGPAFGQAASASLREFVTG
jgi:ABC-type branched-subunit amino acid transport system substrate-binding protein